MPTLTFMPKDGSPRTDESEMLEHVTAERKPTSRLACQITMTEALDGLILAVPARQA